MSITPADLIVDTAVETVDTVKGVFIPLTSLNLTEAQAADGRTFAKAILFSLFDGLDALPTPLTKLRHEEINNVLGDNQRRLTLSFEMDLAIDRTAYQLLPEPA